MNKKFSVFLATCFGISLLSAGLFHLLGGTNNSGIGMLFGSGYMLLPLISVLLTQMICGERLLSGCGVSFKVNRWWFVAWFGFLLFPFIATLASALIPGVGITLESDLMRQSVESFSAKGVPIGPWGIIAITLGSGLLAGATINAVFAFGEEIAWRGFLVRVLEDLGFWKKSILIGVIWGLWHAPFILMGHNYPAHPVAGVFMMIVFCALLSPIMVHIRERSKSVIAAAIAHGTMNATAGISLILLTGGNDLLCGPCGLAGMIVLLVCDIIIFMLRK